MYDPLIVETRPVRRRVRHSENAVHEFRRSLRGVAHVPAETAVEAFRHSYTS